MKEIISKAFSEHFGIHPTFIVRSPGRINLIGEHTDYNNGYVLPAAIDKAIYSGFSARNDGQIHLYSIDSNQVFVSDIKKMERSGLLWPDYILGVADELIKAGHTVGGFNAVVTGDIPIGAGLSSSAALECSIAFGLNAMFGLGLEKIEMVKTAQKAENNFVGMQCGIMDMFASVMGKKNMAILLNCDTLEYKYFPFELGEYKVLLLDTQVKHSLASSAYNDRRRETAQGLAILQAVYPQVEKLADATVDMMLDAIEDPVILKRCIYVTEENLRILGMVEDLAAGRFDDAGKKMFRTHDGLSKMYEVSCAEADFLVDSVRNDESVAGARMMGGGFGGCTINLVRANAIDGLVARLAPVYKEKFGLELKSYVAVPADGTSLI
ncbi:MAG: galactokinase [Chitinophagaceae bacterium]